MALLAVFRFKVVKTDSFFVPLYTKIRKSDMEQRFKTSGQDIDLLPLREFIEREGEEVAYRRGDQMERERLRVGAQAGMGDPMRWFAFVTEGCFKYITYGLSERLRVGDRRSGIERAHITWFSFEVEYVGDYPALLRPVGSKRPQGAERLYGHPAQTTIEAMMPSRVLRVTGEQARNFSQSIKTIKSGKVDSFSGKSAKRT